MSREGEMLVPLLEPLPVVGLTLEAARELVFEKIAEQIIGARAVVTLARLRAISITLAGEVAAPGTYTVSGLTTVSQAVFQAGGVSDIGSLRDIRVLRQGKVIASFDLYALLLRGDATSDIRLRAGDVVFTPVAGGEVTLDGEVRRPAIYEIKAGDTMGKALAMAGGLTPWLTRLQSASNVLVVRRIKALVQHSICLGMRILVRCSLPVMKLSWVAKGFN